MLSGENNKIMPVFLMLALLQGCTLLPAREFEPQDPENMNEWSMEGLLTLDAGDREMQSEFLYRWVDGTWALELRGDNPVGKPRAVLRGDVMDPQAGVSLEVRDEAMRADATLVRDRLPVPHLGFWLRGLPATAGAELDRKPGERLKGIREVQWALRYEAYMQVEDYFLPEEIEMEHDETEVDLELRRAETGFLTHVCAPGRDSGPEPEWPDSDYHDEPVATEGESQTMNPWIKKRSETVNRLVPPDGSAPLPRWVDNETFCAQLQKVHGRIPDPEVGLYGPDSMMWKLMERGLPGALGAGRALLLQIAHPWITTAIDEHSEVRRDPLGRARRTFRNVFAITHGSMPQAMTAANRVHRVHDEIEGEMPHQAGAWEKGSEYRANEINAMIWVHATLWENLVHMYEQFEGELTREEKERFYEETKLFAMLFGIPEETLPGNWDEFMEYNRAMWQSPQLTATDATIQLKEDLFRPRSIWLIGPMWVQEIFTARNLPPRIRDEFGMKYGWWQKFNHAWLKSGFWMANAILPGTLAGNPVDHEARARLEGDQPGPYQRWLIRNIFGQPRLVN